MQDPAGKAEGYREKQCAELARNVRLAFSDEIYQKIAFGTGSWRRICRDGRIATGTLVRFAMLTPRGGAARTQRVLSAWEKLRRAVARLLVAGAAAQDLLPQAKLLLVEAMVTRPTETETEHARIRGCPAR